MSSYKRKNFFGDNLSIKLISLILAILLELYFYSPDNFISATVSADIAIRKLPKTMVLLSPLPEDESLDVKVQIRGPKLLVDQVQSSKLVFNIDYPEGEPRNLTINLHKNQLNLPAGLEVVDIFPRTLIYEFDRLVTKKIQVNAKTEGTVSPGYYVKELKFNPEFVIASGPATEVEDLTDIQIQAVDLNNLKSTQNQNLLISNINPYIKYDLSVINAHIEIAPIISQKSFNKVEIKLVVSKGFAGSLEPSKADIVLEGRVETLDKLQVQDIDLLADCSGLSEGRHEVKIKTNLPDGVNLMSSSPEKLNVILRKQ